MTIQISIKPGLRPDSSQEYYEAWSRPDSGISSTQAVKPGFDRIAAQQAMVKPGFRPDTNTSFCESLEIDQMTVNRQQNEDSRP